MKETDIRKYAELMKELGLTGLEITEENSKGPFGAFRWDFGARNRDILFLNLPAQHRLRPNRKTTSA